MQNWTEFISWKQSEKMLNWQLMQNFPCSSKNWITSVLCLLDSGGPARPTELVRVRTRVREATGSPGPRPPCRRRSRPPPTLTSSPPSSTSSDKTSRRPCWPCRGRGRSRAPTRLRRGGRRRRPCCQRRRPSVHSRLRVRTASRSSPPWLDDSTWRRTATDPRSRGRPSRGRSPGRSGGRPSRPTRKREMKTLKQNENVWENVW